MLSKRAMVTGALLAAGVVLLAPTSLADAPTVFTASGKPVTTEEILNDPTLPAEEDDAVLGEEDVLETGIPEGARNPGNVEPPINRGAPPPPTGTCNGDGDHACPARDPVDPVAGAYDASAVDWNAVKGDIEKVGRHEPRFCNMVIRAWWHDVAGHAPIDEDEYGLVFDGAADGSNFIDLNELFSPEGAVHGFAQFSRHVIVQVAAAHGASHVDVLTVAAAECTKILGGQVDIASHCAAQGIPLSLGKMDYTDPNDIPEWHAHFLKSSNPPGTHNRLIGYFRFLKDINSRISDGNWKIAQDEFISLMGAHTIMMTHACTTTAPQVNGTDMGDRTCSGAGGKQRMFSWDNSFFQDVTSGICRQTNQDAGRDMNAKEHADFTQCGFNSMEGFALGEQLECNAMEMAVVSVNEFSSRGAQRLEGLRKFGAFNQGWFHGVWSPDENAGACCGFQCETCEENPASKFWCGGIIKGEARFWPYTYFDCDFNQVFRLGQTYCDEEGFKSEQCRERWTDEGHPMAEIRGLLDSTISILETFRDSQPAWEEAYAAAFCKLSNFGASYSDSGKVPYTQAVTGAGQGCLSVASVLSPKQCEVCNLEEYETLRGGAPFAPNDSPVPATPAPESPQISAPAPEDSMHVESTAEEPVGAEVAAEEPVEQPTEEAAPETPSVATSPASNEKPAEGDDRWLSAWKSWWGRQTGGARRRLFSLVI